MYKNSINNQWKEYIYKEVKRGVSKSKLEDILKKEYYSPVIINTILYSNESKNNNIVSYCKDPMIMTYSKFLSDEECDFFINISKNNLKRALVQGNEKDEISQERTGKNTWIEHNFNEITKNVAERIAKIIGIPLQNAEKFQVIYYDENQEYKSHYDSWKLENTEKCLRNMKYGGARLVTALCYLNSVEKGGETMFTKLNISVPPEKGKLLIFQNTIGRNNNNIHTLSQHAGTPVKKGKKYGFNLWFRECPMNKLYKDYNPDFYNFIK